MEAHKIPVLATLQRHPDGVFTGLFRTLSIRAQIELRPGPVAYNIRTYHVFAAPNFLFGHGRQNTEPPDAPIDLWLRAPELPQTIEARAVVLDPETWSLEWLRP